MTEECAHRFEHRKRKDGLVGLQCGICGKYNRWIKKADYDKVEIVGEWITPEDQAKLPARIAQQVVQRIKRETESQEWFDEYQIYLASEEWQITRGKVLTRCGHLCEGCRDNRATTVHHLTYIHHPEPFMFELIGLCQPCHDRIHQDVKSWT